MNFISILFLAVVPVFIGAHAQALFSKKEALEQLNKTGIKWHMIDSIIDDAQAKKDLASSAFAPRVGLAFREYYAKINPVQFGGPADLEVLNQVAFGTTALEMSWTIMDPLAQGELLFAKNNLRTSREKKMQYQSEIMAVMFLQYLNVQRL